MSASLALILYVALAGTGGAALLRAARWTRRAPRLGVAAWQVLSVSMLAALFLAGLVIGLPASIESGTLAELLQACVMALRAQYATPGGAAAHLVGLGLSGVILARTAYLMFSTVREARRTRAQHLHRLRLVARRHPRLDVLVVDHPAAAAYCLPGRTGTVVLTSSAVAALSEPEQAAVLAHERAHLRGRHHLVLAASRALAQAVPWVPGLRWAHTEQAGLLEMAADDAAARRHDRLDVARALVNLAGASVPTAALGAADTAAVTRVERLMRPASGLGAATRLVVLTAMVMTAFAPVALAAAPAVAAAQTQYCPITATATVA